MFDRFCILTPLTPKLDARECRRLCKEIENYNGIAVGIDLTFVQDCTIEFIEELYNRAPLNVFNISPDLFSLFNVMDIDKRINLFVSEGDFRENKHRLINRKFSIV